MHRKRSSSSHPPFVDGKHNMTCLQLAESDDLATMMTVDAVLGFTTHKMDKNYNPSLIDRKVREKWKEIMMEFINDLNYDNAYNQLIASDKIKSSLKKDERFKRHIFRFLYLFDKRSGIEVGPCYRYENEGRKGAAIFATREWEKSSQISTLFGCIAEMTLEEEEHFRESKNEFSVMYSTRKNCSQLWLGPAAYVNHDCKPNCRFTEGNDDSKMTLETLRDIHPGDEFLIYYGNNFFGLDNAECECFTCELRDKGWFSRRCQQNNTHSVRPLLTTTANDIEYAPHKSDSYGSAMRRIVTRSTKIIIADNGVEDDKISLPASHAFQGALGRLKRSEDTYSLRVTYSRIDRVKKRILSRTNNSNSNNVDSDSPHSSNTNQPPKSKLNSRTSSRTFLSQPSSKPTTSKPTMKPSNRIATPAIVAQRRSTRQRHSQYKTCAKPGDNQWGKLTIKLRKNAIHPNQYEQIVVNQTLPKPSSESNIFSRITQLYLSQSDPLISRTTLDTPPSLSPWFSSQDKLTRNCHSTKPVLKTKRKLTPNRLSSSSSSSNHNHRRPIIACCDTSSDDCLIVPETTSSSDIPSYDTTSPTIPVLEIEADTELAPPRLVCELFEPELNNSPNKGIVMKFSRVSGNKFTSLLS